MPSLCIVQPYVPKYRVAFFEALSRSLAADGIDLKVVAGKPTGDQAVRGDSQAPPWLERATTRRASLLGKSVDFGGTARHWRSADGVILPLLGSSIDTVLACSRKRQKVGLWGHVAPYTGPGNRIDLAIERWAMRRADHVFAYTPGGGRFAQAAGIPSDRVTAVMNSIDTAALARDLEAVNVEEFRAAHRLPHRPYLTWLGGLDSSKRVEFFCHALDVLDAKGSPIHVLVAGAGAQSDLMTRAVDRGQVTLLGHLSGGPRAAALTAGRAIVNPGRVGLIAVDALVARRAILTTRWPYHAPEFEYLTQGESVFCSDDSPEAFADLMSRTLEDDWTTAIESTPIPTMNDMVENFSDGVRSMFA